MKDKKIKKLVVTAVLMAMTCVATIVIQIPSPMSGYINLGDCLVLLSAWLLGPWYGACAAGIGSAMADVLTAYTHYAPGTLLIKGTMALIAGALFHWPHNAKNHPLLMQLVGGIMAETIMVLGYFTYAGLLLGNGLAAAASIPGNIVQGIFGIGSAAILAHCLEKSHAIKIFT